MPEYLTTRELADLLRIKERKVYELAASGEVPCARVTGKLLFPAEEIRAWLSTGKSTHSPDTTLPEVFLGSHDPLLEWAIRASRSGLATFFDGSLDGLDRFVEGHGVGCGLHLYDKLENSWNLSAVSRRCARQNAVMVRFARRQRGLVVSNRCRIGDLADLAACRVVPRQATSGAQQLFTMLLCDAGIDPSELNTTAAAHSEHDAVLAVRRGHADAAFGLEILAVEYRLEFIPLIEEQFDLLIDRRAWFEPALQRLLAFCDSSVFKQQAAGFTGYAVEGLGEVRWNA